MKKTGVLPVLASLVPLVLAAQAPPPAQPIDVQLQRADSLARDARFRDAVDAYRQVVTSTGDAGGADAVRQRAQAGLALALLRTGDFAGARAEGERLAQTPGAGAAALSLYGDTLWAFGLFDEAERAYEASLAVDGDDPRAHHGRARALTAHNHLPDALVEAQAALKGAPDDPEFHHMVGVIYERQHRFLDAAAAFGTYVSLLPNRDHSEKAVWTRAEIRFLESFKAREPVDFRGSSGASAAAATWRVPIRIEEDKVLVRAKVNGGGAIDFVLDTGAEQTVLSREVAARRGVVPVTYIQTAGVGDVGLRGLEVGRIDSLEVGDLKVRNVPCLIKNPPLGELPTREPESFSPLALGLSMTIDYTRRELVMARSLPKVAHATELPLRLYRLATVRGIVNGQPVSFVVDTGGELISISQSTAGRVMAPGAFRRIPLRVYGTSGWDKDAFLLPNVDLEFNSLRFPRTPVVVLNLNAPSALLGFQVGGIVGHSFLSRFRVTFDVQLSVLALDPG